MERKSAQRRSRQNLKSWRITDQVLTLTHLIEALACLPKRPLDDGRSGKVATIRAPEAVIQLQRLAEAQQQPQPIWRANAWQL